MVNVLTPTSTMGEQPEDYKLPLRQWLIKQIESQKFKGLEWEIPGKTFKLPWEKKHGAGWEKKHEIFRAWAIHRNHSALSDHTKLKANFRSALNKSESFLELKEQNELSRQTGNYKVYQILTPKEVEERKRTSNETKKRKSKQGPSMSTDNSYANANVFNSLENCKPKKEKLCSNTPDYPCSQVSLPPVATIQADFINNNSQSAMAEMSPLTAQNIMVGSGWTTENPLLSDGTNEYGVPLIKNEMSLAAPSDVGWLQSIDDIQPPSLNIANHQAPQPPLTTINQDDFTSTSSQPYDSFLTEFGLHKNKFHITIYYDGVNVLSKTVDDLSKGLRLHFNLPKQSQSAEILRKSNDPHWSNGEILDLPELALPIPENPNLSQRLKKILDAMRLGLTLQFENNCLRVVRYCQSHVFLASPDPPKGQPPYFKLNKYQPTNVFDMFKMIREWRQDITYQCAYLVCGIKPKNTKDIQHEEGVWIKVVSETAEFFNRLSDNQKQSMSNCSLCLSTSTDLEELLRKLSMIQIN